jgi:hypothetical protein
MFNDVHDAQHAVAALQQAGFAHDEIGFLAHDAAGRRIKTEEVDASKASEGAVAGLVAGAGAGGLWALGIAAGLVPAIGPVIAGGYLASLIASAATGAAAGGVLGALIGLGVPDDEAQYYDEAFRSGRHLVSVRAGIRFAEAVEILRSHGGLMQSVDTAPIGDLRERDLADERDLVYSEQTTRRDPSAERLDPPRSAASRPQSYSNRS